MEINPNDCLFIGVDIQPRYVDSCPQPEQTLRHINDLRARVAGAGAPSWQVYMDRQPRKDDGPDERLRIAEAFRLLCQPAVGEPVFAKRDEHPDNLNFDRELRQLAPKAIFFYGYYLDVCVAATARHAENVLADIRIAPKVGFVIDCGQCWYDGDAATPMDNENRAYPIMTSNQLRFPREPAPPPPRRLTPAGPRP